MKSPRGTTWSPHLVLFTVILYFAFTVQASNDCAPSTWQRGEFETPQLSDPTASSNASISVSSPLEANPTGNATISPVTISPLITTGDINPGQVNCRYTGSTERFEVNHHTCALLAKRYGISDESFFKLNPGLQLDCGNIQADTDYCVRGFIEPLRAIDGLCGPPNKNATCLGTEFQCCNANTFTCGNSPEDCAAGTCYEGACAGDSVYTTTGQCGRQHGYRLCAGVWGDCCNADGKCGTGASFCAFGVCQLGNCTIPPTIPGPPSWLNGNTTDGTCGGTNFFTCNVVYGNCCNKNGMCGSLPSDCGAGCQSQWGTCSSSSTTSKALPSSSVVTTSGPITTSGSKSSSCAIKASTTTTISSLPR
ncbi:hypothetical protein V500_00325 [Pseudogymnoascus sp. VKM F-4518 (FW-2643)]|nr:hypothetical protein V500_00325 [Pseudogymnoascus sp. VKM F-4518 (FW-2643)]